MVWVGPLHHTPVAVGRPPINPAKRLNLMGRKRESGCETLVVVRKQ